MKAFNQLKENFPKDTITRVILAVVIVSGIGVAYFASGWVSRLVASTTTVSLPGDPVLPLGVDGGDDLHDEQSESDHSSSLEISLPDPDPWDGTSRVNVLILGLDLRDKEADDAAPRSDTMILLSMDPLNNTASGIAIPRDMWVAVPGYGNYKINTAFRFGELYNLPGGGPQLASKTVEEFLGVPVHYYIQLDFQAFVDFIDHINGIKVTFDEPYTLDRRGKWNTVTLEPGTYVLDGEYTLAYARDRKSEGDDFDRSGRQMEVILLIRQRILEFDQLPTLVMNAPAIYQDLQNGIHTNMSLNQLIRLAWKAREIPQENIKMVVVGPSHVTIEKSPDGLDILRPIPDKVRLLRDEVFSSGGALGPVAEGDLSALVIEENARISVLNASSQPDLGDVTAAWLREQGLNVVESGVAQLSSGSSINLEGSTPYALRWLMATFEMTPGHIDHNFSPASEFDIVLVLGNDWAAKNPMP